MKDALSRRTPLAAVGIAVLLWSTSFGLSAEVLRTASPGVLSVGRFVIGLMILVPIAGRRPGFATTLRQPHTVLLGLLGVALYYSLTNIGLEFTTPGTAALSNAALPALTAISGLLILRERLGLRTIIGLVLATAGVVIVAGSGLGLDLGVVLCLIGLSYALYTVQLRRETASAKSAGRVAGAPAPERVDPIVLATATAIWGTAILLPWLGVEVVSGTASAPTGWAGIGSLIFLGVVITAPTLVLFNYGAERLPAAVTGVMTAAIPALGYLFALLLGEQPDAITALGGGVALIGVLVASWATPSIDSSPQDRHSPPRTKTLASARLPGAVQPQGRRRFVATDESFPSQNHGRDSVVLSAPRSRATLTEAGASTPRSCDRKSSLPESVSNILRADARYSSSWASEGANWRASGRSNGLLLPKTFRAASDADGCALAMVSNDEWKNARQRRTAQTTDRRHERRNLAIIEYP